MLTNNDKIPINEIVLYQNFKYNNIRKVHGGSNAYVLLIIHCDSGSLKITNLDRLIFTKNGEFTI